MNDQKTNVDVCEMTTSEVTENIQLSIAGAAFFILPPLFYLLLDSGVAFEKDYIKYLLWILATSVLMFFAAFAIKKGLRPSMRFIKPPPIPESIFFTGLGLGMCVVVTIGIFNGFQAAALSFLPCGFLGAVLAHVYHWASYQSKK